MCFLPFIAASVPRFAPGNILPTETRSPRTHRARHGPPLAWMIAAQNPTALGATCIPKPGRRPPLPRRIALLRLGHTGCGGEFQANTPAGGRVVMAAVSALHRPGLPCRIGHAAAAQARPNMHLRRAAQFLSEALPDPPAAPAGRAEWRWPTACAGSNVRRGRTGARQDAGAPLLSSASRANACTPPRPPALRRRQEARAGRLRTDAQYDQRSGKFDNRESAASTSTPAAASVWPPPGCRRQAGTEFAAPQLQLRARKCKGQARQLSNERLCRLRSYAAKSTSRTCWWRKRRRPALATSSRLSKQMRARLAQIQRETAPGAGTTASHSTTFCTGVAETPWPISPISVPRAPAASDLET